MSTSTYDFAAPTAAIVVEGTNLDTDITGFVSSVEWDEVIDGASVGTIEVANPNGQFTDSLVFQPGNEVQLSFGYGAQLTPVGRFIIDRHLAFYPASGDATLKISGHDKSNAIIGFNSSGRATQQTYADAIKAIGQIYGLDISGVETFLMEERPIVQKRDINDYQFLRQIAELTGWVLYIEYDQAIGWALRYHAPRDVQTEAYEFIWGQDSGGSLLEFSPSFAVDEATTLVTVNFFDRKTKEWTEIKVEETKPGEPLKFTNAGSVKSAIQSSTEFRISASGPLGEFIHKPFKSAQEAQSFADKWFRARKDTFLVGDGLVVGLPGLRPRQTHKLSGLGTRVSGDYYFTKVRHSWSQDSYRCNFTARKVVT